MLATLDRQHNREEAGGWQHRLASADPALHVHLIGIGGAGLSAIAHVLLEMGMRVSGSDRAASVRTDALAAAGARIFTPQAASHLTGADAVKPDIVLISSAIDAHNPERQAAEMLHLPVVKRDEFLSVLLAQRTLIAVAGTHGKSTTTAMIVTLLRGSGIDAGYIIGAEAPGIGSAAAGDGDIFVLEADEYDHMFLGLAPTVAVITSVEWDHPDCFPTAQSFTDAFATFIDGVKADGLVIYCADDPGARTLMATRATDASPQLISYGCQALLPDGPDFRASEVCERPGTGAQCELSWWHAPVGMLDLDVPGLHNVHNALAALLVGSWCNVPLPDALQSLASFQGVGRRFEIKGVAGGVTVIDDYAHHPTEVRATLSAARARYPQARIWAIFQPHTFSRTRAYLAEMADAFADADRVIVTDIFAAREIDDGAVHAAQLAAESSHTAIEYIGALDAAAAAVTKAVKRDDVVITLGAGDGYRVGESVLAALQAAEACRA